MSAAACWVFGVGLRDNRISIGALKIDRKVNREWFWYIMVAATILAVASLSEAVKALYAL